jgi:hypothetical protein
MARETSGLPTLPGACMSNATDLLLYTTTGHHAWQPIPPSTVHEQEDLCLTRNQNLHWHFNTWAFQFRAFLNLRRTLWLVQAMHEELEEQAPKLDRLNERTEAAHADLSTVHRDTARLARRGPAAAGRAGIGSIERQAVAAATAARYAAAQAAKPGA